MRRLHISLNPIAFREVRARWRRRPALLILFGYAVVLSLAIGLSYFEFSQRFDGLTEHTTSPSAVLGQRLFAVLAWLGAAGWMMLAPMLAAPAIVSEREKGLLQGLLISRLTPQQIVLGKLQSLLWFIGLLLLVPLPILSTCFLLGGVAPHQVFAVALLHAVTAATGCAIGLNCSAWETTTNKALIRAAGHTFLWFLVTPCFCGGAFVNPLIGIAVITSTSTIGSVGELFMAAWSIGGQSVFIFLLICSAVRGLERPVELEIEEREPLEPFILPPAGLENQAPSRHGHLPVPQPAPELPLIAQPPPKIWTPPLLPRLHFKNPICEYEFHRRLRIPYAWYLHGAPVLALTLIYTTALALCSRSGDAVYFAIAEGWIIIHVWLLALVVGAALMGALCFSRDRETGVLPSLLVTPLRAREIIAGKLAPPLLLMACYSLLPLPVVLCCLRDYAEYMWGGTVLRGLTLIQLASAVLVLAATAVGVLIFAATISWFCRRVSVANGWTLALLFGLLAALPALAAGVVGEVSRWSPFHVLQRIAVYHTPGEPIAAALEYALRIVIAAGLMLWFLHWSVKRGWCERDRSRMAILSEAVPEEITRRAVKSAA